GGQILGASPDFTHRLLDDALKEVADGPSQEIDYKEIPFNYDLNKLPKVIDYLEKEGLFIRETENNEEPDDITKKTIEFPSTRSQRLQGLTRGQTGAVTSLGYAEIRGYGIASHPNIGECRVGQQPVCVDFEDGYGEYFIGDYEMTEIDGFMPDLDEDQDEDMHIKIGYGLVLGQTGAVTSLGYAEIRGYGIASHPNIGECRVGQQPVCVDFEDGYGEYFIGDYEMTEIDGFMPDLDEDQDEDMHIKIGYGLVFG